MTKHTITVQRSPSRSRHETGPRPATVTIWDRRRRNPRARLRLMMMDYQADLARLTAWLTPRVDDPGQWIVENLPELWEANMQAFLKPKGALKSPMTLSPWQREELRRQWERLHAGPGISQRIVLKPIE